MRIVYISDAVPSLLPPKVLHHEFYPRLHDFPALYPHFGAASPRRNRENVPSVSKHGQSPVQQPQYFSSFKQIFSRPAADGGVLQAAGQRLPRPGGC